MLNLQELPRRETTTLSEIRQDAAGKQALAILFPKIKGTSEIDEVTLIKNEKEAADFVVASMWLAYAECFIQNKKFDWKEYDPLTKLKVLRVGIQGRGRNDARGIGEPKGNEIVTAPKRGLLSRLRHPFGGGQ